MNVRTWRASAAIFLSLFVSVCSRSGRSITVLCAGDSITAATYPNLLERLLNDAGIRAKVINCGRNGNTSGEYLKFLLKCREDLARKHPDFILLQLGTNDVRVDGDSTPTEIFGSNMRKIVGIFRAFRNVEGKSPVVLIATIPPVPLGVGHPFSARSRERVTSEINPRIREICQKENIPLVDNYALFAGSPELLPDVHPNQEGYGRLARNWYRALKSLL